jgi:protein gp37
MGKASTIGWTNHTFNPWIGCQEVTEEECGDCYAKRWAHRHHLNVWGPLMSSPRHLTKTTWPDPRAWNAEAEREGRRDKVFCASLADIFEPHRAVAEARLRLWDLIEATPQLDWQLLTKRPKFIRRLVPGSWLTGEWPSHVWIGTSVGIQRVAAKRLPYVLELPAPVRFVSAEPLVELVTLAPSLATGRLDWVICGGYSGDQHRPMKLAWARALRDECRAYGVAFFMKQLGSDYAKAHGLHNGKGEDIQEFPEDLRIQEFPVLSQDDHRNVRMSLVPRTSTTRRTHDQ